MAGQAFHPAYRLLVARLVSERKAAGLSQRDLAHLLSARQSFVSKYEILERQLDIIEFIQICSAIGCDPKEAFRLVLQDVPPTRPPENPGDTGLED